MTPSSPPGKSRRRKERANVKKRLKGVYIRSEELSEKEIRVVNISELGLGVETSSLETPPQEGAEIEVHLLVGKTSAPVRVRVVHVNPEITGIEFVDPSSLIRGAVRNYFEPELVGASLRPVNEPPDSLPPGTPFELKFQDKESNALALTVRDKRIVAFAIGVMGNTVQWKHGGPVQLVQNGKTEPLGDFLRSQLVKFAQSADSVDPEYQQEFETILLLNEAPAKARS